MAGLGDPGPVMELAQDISVLPVTCDVVKMIMIMMMMMMSYLVTRSDPASRKQPQWPWLSLRSQPSGQW